MSENIEKIIPDSLLQLFEFYSYRNAAVILAKRFPHVFDDLLNTLLNFELSKRMVRTPGGSKGPIVDHINSKFGDNWRREARISAALNVKIRTKRPPEQQEYIREGFLDGHQIDYLFDRVALDVEWNSKDQTFDRDLYAFSAFYQADAIDMGIILTRGKSIDDTDFLKDLGTVLNKDGSDGAELVHKKFGASTTTMRKLLYRLEAGRNGGCPVLAIGIKAEAFS